MNFKYATTVHTYLGMVSWELYYHSLEGKKCIKFGSIHRRFLNAEDASILYYVSMVYLWDELPWIAQIKLNYNFYSVQICDLAHFYRKSDKKGYVIRYNICNTEQLVQGSFLFDSNVLITK